jgi:hypothetical protein
MTSRWSMGKSRRQKKPCGNYLDAPQMSRKGCDFPLPVEWHSACNFRVQLSFAAEIFRALAPGRERDIETYEKLYSRGLLEE